MTTSESPRNIAADVTQEPSDIGSVLSELNRRHGWQLEDPRRCSGGFQGGAWLVDEPTLGRVIVKAREDDAGSFRPGAMPMVRALRAQGYPTPAWLAAGITDERVSYVVQEELPGRPLLWSDELLPELLAIIELQAGRAPETQRDWSTYVVTVPRKDSDLVSQVRSAGSAGTGLADHLLTLVGSAKGADTSPPVLPNGDAVHGDLNTGNALVDNGRISGVIDIEAMGRGTRAIDYGWLLREAYVNDVGADAMAIIRRAGDAVAGPEVLRWCVAATGIDIAAFQVRHAGTLDPTMVERLHGMADELGR